MATIGDLTDPELLRLWDRESDNKVRNEILKQLEKRDLFPASFMKQWEQDTGAYPSTEDPLFLQKLLAKREFAESFQDNWKPEEDPCGDVNKFEVTPVQRFVANLMSPKSPYMSALLYHGVGVGKTCAAVQIAEAWLQAYPKDQIYLVAPPTIQEGFYRTIFDISRMKTGEGLQDPNTQVGCTGNTYLDLTGMTYEKDQARIYRRIRKAINRRYNIFGYLSFANHVERLLSGVDRELSEEEQEQAEYEIINREFSGKILIIDEAHNVRDIVPDSEKDDDAVKPTARSDMADGKQMTPFLRKVLEYAQGLKLVLLTATPMYNSYKEIIFMLNLLLKNDKKATITERMIFHSDGTLRSKGKERLGYIASRYVSFMRGENPLSFPIRLDPEEIPLLRDIAYPIQNPRGTDIEDEIVFKDHLPIVPIELEDEALEASRLLVEDLDEGSQGIAPILLGTIIQAGNFFPPSDDEGPLTLEAVKDRLAVDSLDNLFTKSKGSEVVYKSRKKGGGSWLARDEIGRYSPKFAFLLDQLQTAKGVCFVYMRAVNLGALPLALVLEANGYSPVGRDSGLLGDGIIAEGGFQCALCDKKEKTHSGADHKFVKARYGLITGNQALTPNNKGVIDYERQEGNEQGALMKVIIGSQIAGEGVDLRYVREVHMLDSWYHLNRTEQVIGRAIRFCSHSALPKEQRNATIHLYAAVFPEEDDKETGDLYSYRQAFKKAVEVGNVTRALKIRAIDCNLNHDAIIIQNEKSVKQIDSKGELRTKVNINDKPFTAICDWNESCYYDCNPKINVDELTGDDSTYSEFAAKWRESALKQQFRDLFKETAFYEAAPFWNDLFGDVPLAARSELFASVIDNRAFQVTHKGVKGYIKYCNGYYVFQPSIYMDLRIPMSIRTANLPVRRDYFEPIVNEVVEVEEAKAAAASARVPAKFSLTEAWAATLEWANLFKEVEKGEPTPTDMPDALYDRINYLANGEPDVQEKYNNIVQTVQWLHTSVMNSGASRRTFAKALVDYIWDNWFSMEEQIELVATGAPKANDMVRSVQNTVGSTVVNRYFNPEDASIVYMCGSDICPAPIISEVQREERDVPDLFIDQEAGYKTGDQYGFMTSHNTELVFKLDEGIVPGSKVKLRGTQCKNVTNISYQYEKLLDLGRILQRASLPTLELTTDVVKMGARQIVGAIRACALLELVLRYMDHASVNGRKWFFRPVMARLIGYKGQFKRATASTKSVAPKQVKSKAKTAPAKEEEEEEEEESSASEEKVKAPVKRTLLRRKVVEK
jgi:hypothetical protein